MAKKAKPKKDAENLRVHNDVVIKLRKAHPRFIARAGQVSSFVDFTDAVIEAGLAAITLKNRQGH